ncbi:MAG TPA: hypothetical protein VGC41_13770 [Kofleriaceae bacterium]
MKEQAACALLKARFEKAGYHIEQNVTFDEDGVSFEVDGFDDEKRVGYEYLTEEAGDSWDVDSDVIAKLNERRDAGEVFILVVSEADAPDAKSLTSAADVFLEQLKPAVKKPATKKPTAKKPTAKKPAAKKPAAKPTAKRKK